MRLRNSALTPQPLAAQHADPRLILFDSITNIELIGRIPPLQLLQFNSTKFAPYPTVHMSKKPITADVPVIIYPASQQHIKPVNLFLESARLITPSQIPNLVLKTADTLRGHSKAAVVKTGGSQESFFRLRGRPPISPY